MGTETITFARQGAVGLLRLNRPECLNAVNHVMRDELTAFWQERCRDEETKAIVVLGAGRGFCSGLDISDPVLMGPEVTREPAEVWKAQRSFSELILLMRRCPQPLVGAIQGAAVGAGFAFAMACDVRLATAKARFQAAYINLGLGGADMGSSWLLPRAVGAGNAARYLLTGDFLGAEEALRIGFVQQITEAEQLEEEALALAQAIAMKSPLGLRLTKQALDVNAGGPSLEQAILLEDRNQALCITQLAAR